MKNNIITLIALVPILLFSNFSFAQSPTAPALGFNAFFQQGATLTTNESEGSIAIGGNLTVNGNYQVNIHSVGTFSVNNAPIGLFVGGQVVLSSGSLQVNSGRYVKIGNCAASNIKTWYRDNNNATSNIYITGSSSSYASTPNININSNALAWGTEVSASNNPICDANTASELNFSTAFTTMQASATSMAACNTSGNILSNPNQNVFGATISSVLTSGQVKITLASGTNVLNVSGADLNSVTNGITFTNSPDASHVLVINVNAAGSYTWNVWNQGGISGNNAPYIIYNFYNTTSLNIAGNNTIEGTVFAPNAAITKTVNQSNIEGQVIGQSFIQNGGELHYYPFTPTITGCAVACTPTSANLNVSACSSFTWHGTTFNASGNYTFDSLNKSGCDSLTTLHLTIKQPSTSTTNASICAGSSYSFNGTSYSTTGSYTAHLTNAAGCDSAATLVLKVNSLPTTPIISLTQPVCGFTTGNITITSPLGSGYMYSINGTTYQSATSFVSVPQNATYNVTVKDANNCVSVSTPAMINTAPTKLYDFSYVTNASTQPLSNNSFSFTTVNNAVSDNITWDFGDGTIAVSPSPTKTYATFGIYNARAIATNVGGCSDTSFQTVIVTPTSKVMQSVPTCGSRVAHSITQTVIFPSSSTDWSGTALKTKTANQFNSALGTLTGVKIVNKGSITNHTQVEVTGNMAAGTKRLVNISIQGSMSFAGPGFLYGFTPLAIIDTFSSTGFDGKKDFAGTSGKDFGFVTTSSTDSTVFTTPSLLAAYQGNGQITLTAYTNTSSSASIPTGNDTMSMTTTALDTAVIVYYYCPNADTSITNLSVCASAMPYNWNGNTFNVAGTYTVTLTNAAGGDSVAILNLVVKNISSSITTASICAGSSYTFNGTSYSNTGSYTAHLTNAAGCDSAATLVLTIKQPTTSTTNASICAGSSYTFNGTSYSNAGSYTAHLTNAAGCDSAATLVLTVTPLPTMSSIIGNNNLCAGTSTLLTDNTIGGVWASSDTSIAKIDNKGNVTAIADGNTVITYTITAACTNYASYPIEVKCDTSGSVSSGGTGGLESKSLGAAIGTRNFNIYKNSQNGAVVYTESQKIIAPKRGSISTFGIINTTSLAALMPSSANKIYTAYDQSAAVADLTSITNAIDVRAIDFTLNNSPKAVAFATKTAGAIYSHTKTICDRLKGAQLLDVKKVIISNISFIQYKIQQANGDLEYAISFSAGQKAGRNAFSIQSNWLMKDYVSEDTMYNYQLWAANQTDVTTMVSEVLGKLQANKSLIELNSNDLPTAYVAAANRQGSTLNITINNRTANTIGYFELKQTAAENSTSQMTDIFPFTINANGKTTVSIPVNDNYDANISMVFNNSTTDALYMADGIWGTSGDNKTTVTRMNVVNNSNKQYSSNEYPLLRDVNVNVTTPSYVSIYKYLKGGAASVDLSIYKSFHFTASTNASGMNMKVTITKQNVGNWNSQYSYTINNFQDGQTYSIAMSDFKSTDATLPTTIDASDITSVIYNVENTSGQTLSFNAGISNAAFSTEDIALERALEVKTMNVSPNPSNGNFKVSFVTPSNVQLRLAITDITGRIIGSQIVNALTGTNEVAVSLGSAINGSIYFVSLQGADSKYITQKMLIKK